MSYLHGVQIRERLGLQIFSDADTAIPAIVGIAEQGRTNQVVLITSLAEAETEFGRDLEGTTIMSALTEILSDKRVPVLVVNVASGTKLTAMMDTGTNKVKVTSGKPCTQVHEETLATGAGLVNFETELIAGLELLKQSLASFGLAPNFIGVPGYSQVQNVMTKMRTIATFFKGKAIVDMFATSVSNAATTKRTTTYDFSDKRVVLCYPNIIQYNEEEAKDVVVPLSQIWINEAIKTHNDPSKGYWHSPSNVEIVKAKKTVVPMVFSTTDSGGDNQLLNSKGIVTVVKIKGSNFRLSGNWTSAFPTDTNMRAQIAPSIVKDAIEETIKRESYKFVDKNIDYSTLDQIVAAVQNYFYTLKGKRAITDGTISYSQIKNPLSQVAAGQFVFDYSYCEVPTLDTITYEAFQDLEMLKSLFKN